MAAHSPPLLLNDSITVYFSHDILPVSVTADSVTLVDEQGQSVPGSLLVGANWLTFQPKPPLAADLQDGSFRPGANYRLMVAGSPRPDAVRSLDDRRLAEATTFDVRIAAQQDRPPGLLALLRPPANDLPFVLRAPNLPQQLPADAPRLLLHFTQPLLPASVTPAAFEVTLRAAPPVELIPRAVRAFTSRLDDEFGCSVEIDLGALPRRVRDQLASPLTRGDMISVALARGPNSVLDYSGNAPLQATPQLWSVVAGNSVALAEWPTGGDRMPADDGLSPSFEARGGVIRPRVRVEAGDGSLGVFHPRCNLTLRPGQPFDRGDGQIVVSRGAEFPFLTIEVPEGVIVRVETSPGSPVHLLACGGMRIAGTLELVTAPAALPPRRFQTVREIVQESPIALVAAGDIDLRGRILTPSPPTEGATSLMLASAGSIDLRGLQGDLPFHTLLVVESGATGDESAILGTRGQSIVFFASFTYGVAAGADYSVRGLTSWRQLPVDRDGGVLHLVDADPNLQVAWQSAPADPVRKNEPDMTIGRVGRLQQARDGDSIAVLAGAFVRFALTARVRAGSEPPRMRELRLSDR